MSTGEAVLVVAAGTDIGQMTARRFVRAGRPVGVIARNEKRLAGFVAELRTAGAEAAYGLADVRDDAAVRAAAQDRVC